MCVLRVASCVWRQNRTAHAVVWPLLAPPQNPVLLRMGDSMATVAGPCAYRPTESCHLRCQEPALSQLLFAARLSQIRGSLPLIAVRHGRNFRSHAFWPRQCTARTVNLSTMPNNQDHHVVDPQRQTGMALQLHEAPHKSRVQWQAKAQVRLPARPSRSEVHGQEQILTDVASSSLIAHLPTRFLV